ncbi:MAG TPA: BrnA antitoxin family protein [Candidatus Binatia bacterium]
MKSRAKQGKPKFRRVAHPRIYQPEELSLSNAKVNIHIRLDADILNHFKEKAAREGKKYQSLINQHLRETALEEESLESRVRRIEEQLGKAAS